LAEKPAVNDRVVIPFDRLSPEALRGVIEEFITREGTDYGAVEFSLEEKVEQVRAQLRAGAAQIVFDPGLESCTIMTREDIRRLENDEN
jgi:uncharacterized protein YheU (UPF0270 family)